MTSSSNSRRSAILVILLAGLVAGTLDITAACVSSWIQNGVTPDRVFRYIATGVLGPSALTAGAGTAALGLFLHYVIATGWAVVFYIASRFVGPLTTHPIPSGLVYGVVVYLLMNFVVVPLSQVPARRTSPEFHQRALQATILMVCIGVPIALIVRRFGQVPPQNRGA